MVITLPEKNDTELMTYIQTNSSFFSQTKCGIQNYKEDTN